MVDTHGHYMVAGCRYELREDRGREAGRKESYLAVLRQDIAAMVRDVLRNGTGNNINQSHMTTLSRRQDFARMGSKSKTHDNLSENNLTFQNQNSQTVQMGVQYSPENIRTHWESNNSTRLNSDDFMRMRSDTSSSHTSNPFPLPDITSGPYRSHSWVPYVPRATSAADNIDRVPSGSILQAPDIECIRLEMMETLRREVREAARDVAFNYLHSSGNGPLIPDVDSELYQTHLYTQL